MTGYSVLGEGGVSLLLVDYSVPIICRLGPNLSRRSRFPLRDRTGNYESRRKNDQDGNPFKCF